MKKGLIVVLFFFSIPVLHANTYLTFEKSEYANRRENLMKMIPDGIAIIRGASMPLGNGHFYQFNNMIYFTGVKIPDVILVIDGINKESILFFTIDERSADSENIPLEIVRNPVKTTGIEKHQPYEDFSHYLKERINSNVVIYTPFISEESIGECTREKYNKFVRSVTEDEWDGRLTREMQFAKLIGERFPGNKVADCSPLIWELRKIKSKTEIEIMRKAAQLGVKAHKEVIKNTKPGAEEFKLAALFEYICKAGGAQGLAFATIIMSAEHHAYGHYSQYDRTLENGDFIILDGGPDVDYYDADISTTFPANGKFSEKQKQIYEFCLKVREVCLNSYKPGISLTEVGAEVEKMLKINGYDTTERKYRSYIRNGGYNHSIGMAVHDKMEGFSREEPLKEGFVFACDIMARADSVTGVRIEDTVVITENGCEILSSGLPRTVQEIESFMNINSEN